MAIKRLMKITSEKITVGKSGSVAIMLLLFLLVSVTVNAQKGIAIVYGKVTDTKGNVLPNANIMVKGSSYGVATDLNGLYTLKLPVSNSNTLEVTYVGYEKALRNIKINRGDTLNIDFILKSLAFNIGGIEVLAKNDLLPEDISSGTVINSGQIEHYQASSIKDVLDLVPGVQKSDNPGLNRTSQAAIRGEDSDQLAAFGTSIIIDGTPVSNNANLQFEKLTGSKFGSNNMGGGVDLRTIPADNIESIEVITGLPSVRYGDFTSGVINIKTKKGDLPTRFKFKSNPDVLEGNLSGGVLVGESSLSYNLNVAESERDIRKEGDEYTRITGQTVYSDDYLGGKLEMNNKVNFQFIFDEEEPRGDQQRIKNYNRGFTLGYSNWGEYIFAENVNYLEYSAFVTMRRENSMRSRLVQSDLRILPNGDTVSVYAGKVETKGIEWTVGGRLEWNKVFYTGEFIHKFVVGTNPQYNVNTGEGLLLDTLYNYYGSESKRRSYEFDDIPGQLLANIYIEDKISGHFLLDFNMSLGLRYDMYRPKGFNVIGLWGDGDLVESHQGSFINPRFKLKLYLSENSQLRLSVGSTSKSPPMASIYPPETVFTWRNPADSSINYFSYDRHVPELKGYREWQYEASYDHKFFNKLGATLSAYYKSRDDEPEGETIPVFYTHDVNSGKNVYYIDSYNLYTNAGFTVSKGLEFSLNTRKIEPLNMEFKIVGSYNHIKYGSGLNYYDNTPDETVGQYDNYLVPGSDTLIGMVYPSGENWRDRFQLNYYVKYTSKELGLWLTFRAEQLVFERSQNKNRQPVDVSLLNETQLINYYFDREIKTKPNKWLLSLSMSKSLFKGAEVSFYVNNFLDDPAIRRYSSTPNTISEEIRNPDLFYGLEFSMIIESFIGNGK